MYVCMYSYAYMYMYVELINHKEAIPCTRTIDKGNYWSYHQDYPISRGDIYQKIIAEKLNQHSLLHLAV